MLAIDVASAGALDGVARAQLERHLARCESCRGYRDRSTEVSALVAAPVVEATLSPTRWQEIERQLMKAAADRWGWVKRTASTVAFAVVLAFAAHFLDGKQLSASSWAIIAVGMTVFLGSLYGYKQRRLQRELAVRDVMSVYRQQLQRMLRVWRTLRWFIPVSATYALLVCLADPDLVHTTIAVGQIVTFFTLRHAVRHARRELAVLS
jgi:hypothetical protein